MTDRRQIQLDGLFISAKRNCLTRPDGSFADLKQSIIGMLAPPCDGFNEEAWRTIGEIGDGTRLTPQPWHDLPAVRALPMTSPRYAAQIKGFPKLRPWAVLLAAIAVGRKPGEPLRTATVLAPLEHDPQKWPGLSWRFADSGELVVFDAPDADGFAWRLRTLREFLTAYAHHPIPEMLAPDGSPCGAYTRGVLLRRPVRDADRYLIMKEAAVYGDDPRNAFSVPSAESVRQSGMAERRAAAAIWEGTIKPALAAVGPETVTRKMGMKPRTARAWLAGDRRPDQPYPVARAIVAVARDSGLCLPSDEHLRTEEICAALPTRVAAVQWFISATVAMFAAKFGGIRAFARAVGEDEPSVRRWGALAAGELRPITHLNGIVAKVAKFARAEVRKAHRRITTERGPTGDQEAVTACLSLLYGNEWPGIVAPEVTIVILVAIVIVYLSVANGTLLMR
jgi:hypothetical protein